MFVLIYRYFSEGDWWGYGIVRRWIVIYRYDFEIDSSCFMILIIFIFFNWHDIYLGIIVDKIILGVCFVIVENKILFRISLKFNMILSEKFVYILEINDDYSSCISYNWMYLNLNKFQFCFIIIFSNVLTILINEWGKWGDRDSYCKTT